MDSDTSISGHRALFGIVWGTGATMRQFLPKERDALGDAQLKRWYDIYDECQELAVSCKKSEEEFGAAALGAIAYRVAGEIKLRQHELAPEKFPHPKQRAARIAGSTRRRRKQPTEP